MKALLPAIILVSISVSMWTHPVLIAVETYATASAYSYGGALAGTAEELPNKIQLEVIDDIDPATMASAIADGVSCATATTWICNNRSSVDPVAVTSVVTWKRPGVRYCVARCDAAGDIYAFVAVIGTWIEEIP